MGRPPGKENEDKDERRRRDDAEDDPAPDPELRQEHDREKDAEEDEDDRDRRKLHPVAVLHALLLFPLAINSIPELPTSCRRGERLLGRLLPPPEGERDEREDEHRGHGRTDERGSVLGTMWPVSRPIVVIATTSGRAVAE